MAPPGRDTDPLAPPPPPVVAVRSGPPEPDPPPPDPAPGGPSQGPPQGLSGGGGIGSKLSQMTCAMARTGVRKTATARSAVSQERRAVRFEVTAMFLMLGP